MLQTANAPVVIAGSGVWYADAGEALRIFVERTGIPVFTGNSGRGAISDTHPLCFQSSLAIRPGAAFFTLASADLILFLGSRLSLFYLFGDIFRKDAKFIQADIEAEEIGRNRSVDLGVVGDVRALLEELNRLIEAQGIGGALRSRFQGWVETVRKADADGKAPTQPLWESERRSHPSAPSRPRGGRLHGPGGGHRRGRRGRHPGLDGDDPDGRDRAATISIRGSTAASAVGLPFANAAKLRHPESRVLLIIGDGSVGFNFMEFHTAIRRGLPIVVVIANDQSWGMIAHSQTLRMGHSIPDGTWLGRVDYHRLVEALGGFGALVERPEEIRPALEAAFASGKTACINVMVDPTVISPGSVALANLGGYCAGK